LKQKVLFRQDHLDTLTGP